MSENSTPETESDRPDVPDQNSGRGRSFQPAGMPWIPYVIPMLLYLALSQFDPQVSRPQPTPSPSATAAPDDMGDGQRSEPLTEPMTESVRDAGSDLPSSQNRRWGLDYPQWYVLKIAVVALSMLAFLPLYRDLGWRLDVETIVFGLLGATLWIGICRLGWNESLGRLLGLGSLLPLGERPGFDPWTSIASQDVWRSVFLGVRFLGLALIIPIIEEVFLRGFLIRFVESGDWNRLRVDELGPKAYLAATAYGVVAHPSEWLAALVWFSLISLLMWRTKRISSCIVAHAITNLLLGLYVVLWQDWQWW